MAKKIQRKTKPKIARSTSHPFLAAQQSDLAGIAPATGKGPHKDRAGTQLMAPAIRLGEPKPGSRED